MGLVTLALECAPNRRAYPWVLSRLATFLDGMGEAELSTMDGDALRCRVRSMAEREGCSGP